MIERDMKNEISRSVCPECKNDIDLSRYPNLVPGMVIECDHCGMTLLVKDIKDGGVETEIVDEGK